MRPLLSMEGADAESVAKWLKAWLWFMRKARPWGQGPCLRCGAAGGLDWTGRQRQQGPWHLITRACMVQPEPWALAAVRLAIGWGIPEVCPG